MPRPTIVHRSESDVAAHVSARVATRGLQRTNRLNPSTILANATRGDREPHLEAEPNVARLGDGGTNEGLTLRTLPTMTHKLAKGR